MTQYSDRDHIINQGTLRSERGRVDFYTTCPAPNQWSAVGVLVINSLSDEGDDRRRLIVGNGMTEDAAITDLRHQFAEVVEFADNASPSQPGQSLPEPSARDQSHQTHVLT